MPDTDSWRDADEEPGNSCGFRVRVSLVRREEVAGHQLMKWDFVLV
jgi:sucrose-6-phosphate hydrolase SacC (GH32 family)